MQTIKKYLIILWDAVVIVFLWLKLNIPKAWNGMVSIYETLFLKKNKVQGNANDTK